MNAPSKIVACAACALLLSLAAATGCGRSPDAGPSKDSGGGNPAAPAQAPAGSGAPAAPVAPAAPAAGSPSAAAAPKGEAAPNTLQNPVPAGVDPKKPIAKVNGTAITAEQGYTIYQMNKAMIEQRGHALNEQQDQALRAQVLQQLIGEELLFQGAGSAGIKVTPAELDGKLKELHAQAGSEENFKKIMASSGMSDAEVRTELERRLRIDAYEKTIASSKGVTEDVARKFYDENRDGFKTPELARVQFILLKATDKDPETVRSDSKARAEEAQKKAAGGADFTALAKQYSQDGTASKGGDVGYFPRGVMFPKFEEYAFTLAPGGVSPVFETPKGFNVMKVVERKPEAIRPFDEVKGQLMLDMGRALGQKLVSDKVNDMAGKAKIEVLDAAFKAPPPPPSTIAPAAAPSGKK
jgi:parvulin-like peptidyl-prolyl isomerase